MKLEIKHLASYLPYGLNCQYEGIINGKELSAQRKEYKLDNEPFENWRYFEPIEEIKGLKIAPLKNIRTYKKYWVASCGIYNTGQKNFYNGIGLKPILRPLSDLVKEIDVNGEKFTPMERLLDIETKHNWSCSDYLECESGQNEWWVKMKGKIPSYIFGYNSIMGFYLLNQFSEKEFVRNQIELFEKLYEWHFDVFGLIEKGLAISINEINP